MIVNGAVSGQDSTVLADPTSMYWTFVQDRLTALGLTSAQVQVAWLKEAKINPDGRIPARDPAATRPVEGGFSSRTSTRSSRNMRICYNSSCICRLRGYF
ncbi:MAG: hypothetical protein U0166_16620 [Acidobacteriota bacterium]